MSGTKALGVLLAVAALLLAAPASALLADLTDGSVVPRAGESPEAVPVPQDAPTPPSEEIAETTDTLTDIADDPPTDPVAIAQIDLDDGEKIVHPWNCHPAKDVPAEAYDCDPGRATDVAIRDDRAAIVVTLTNPNDPPTARTVTVTLLEDGTPVVTRTVTMEVHVDRHVVHRYEPACDCTVPARLWTDVYQGRMKVAMGTVQAGSTYQVVATSTVADADPADAGAQTDATGDWQVSQAETAAQAGSTPSLAASSMGGIAAVLVALVATVAGGAWIVTRM